jgi:predicted RNA-binding Zn-ribbon protein involved in translation (DUF1610 family)
VSESPSQDEQQIKCPQCGAPVTRTNAGDFDASGHERVEFTCPNHHRTIVVLVETDDDDLDPAV